VLAWSSRHRPTSLLRELKFFQKLLFAFLVPEKASASSLLAGMEG
jgi:hypothetical protein